MASNPATASVSTWAAATGRLTTVSVEEMSNPLVLDVIE